MTSFKDDRRGVRTSPQHLQIYAASTDPRGRGTCSVWSSHTDGDGGGGDTDWLCRTMMPPPLRIVIWPRGAGRERGRVGYARTPSAADYPVPESGTVRVKGCMNEEEEDGVKDWVKGPDDRNTGTWMKRHSCPRNGRSVVGGHRARLVTGRGCASGGRPPPGPPPANSDYYTSSALLFPVVRCRPRCTSTPFLRTLKRTCADRLSRPSEEGLASSGMSG